MAVTVTGFRGGVNPQTQQSGLDALKQADAAKAKEVLASLSNDLANKSGVVRLLHTSHADKDMKFKNAGAFKRMFLSGDKLQRSGEVIHDLLKTAGLSPAKAKEFMAYVEKRGDKGVQAQKVLQYVDALRAETGSTPARALSKFGVDLGAPGRKLGEGGFGEVHVLRYRGEDFVYKQPGTKSKEDNLGGLQLADASGKPLQPKGGSGKLDQSFQEFVDDSPQVKAPAVTYLDQAPADYDQDGRGSTDSFGNPKWRQALPAQTVKNPEPLIVEESVSNPPAVDVPPQAPVSVPGQRLARSGLANAARVKYLPQVITPSVYVVREQNANGEDTFHAVAGQQRLKDWARTQRSDSKFDVVGLLMPKAAGKSPIQYFEPPAPKKGTDEEPPAPPSKSHVSTSDLKPMAQSALSLLTGLAKHGFIHGDIKPENLMWDTKTKTLQVIDNDGLQKVSKKPGSQVNPGLDTRTELYFNPVGYNQKYYESSSGQTSYGTFKYQMGVGRDLFAMGMTLLETALTSRGQEKKAKDLMSQITGQNSNPSRQALFESYKQGVEALKAENFPPNSVEAFARSCIVKAIEYEQIRLDRQDFGFDRYNEADDQHLLSQLQRELEQVR